MGLRKRKNNLLYQDLNVGKYMIMFFRKINGKYVLVEKKKLKIEHTKFRFHNRDFTLMKFEWVLYSDNKFNYYGFDFDKQTQLCFNEGGKLPEGITLEDIDIYINRNVIAQAIQGLEKLDSKKSQWLMLIVGACIGFGIGFFASNAMQQQNANFILINIWGLI